MLMTDKNRKIELEWEGGWWRGVDWSGHENESRAEQTGEKPTTYPAESAPLLLDFPGLLRSGQRAGLAATPAHGKRLVRPQIASTGRKRTQSAESSGAGVAARGPGPAPSSQQEAQQSGQFDVQKHVVFFSQDLSIGSGQSAGGQIAVESQQCPAQRALPSTQRMGWRRFPGAQFEQPQESQFQSPTSPALHYQERIEEEFENRSQSSQRGLAQRRRFPQFRSLWQQARVIANDPVFFPYHSTCFWF